MFTLLDVMMAGSESWVVRSLRRLVADLGALSSGEFVTVDLDALQFFCDSLERILRELVAFELLAGSRVSDGGPRGSLESLHGLK